MFLAIDNLNGTYDLKDSKAINTYYSGSRASPKVPNYNFYFKATTWPLVIRTVLLIFGMYKAGN